jgi:hypothetical protein
LNLDLLEIGKVLALCKVEEDSFNVSPVFDSMEIISEIVRTVAVILLETKQQPSMKSQLSYRIEKSLM